MGCLSSKPEEALEAPESAAAAAAVPVPVAVPAPAPVAAPAPVPPPPPAPEPQPELTAEELEAEAALRNVFELFATMDTNKSGTVDAIELAAALKLLPVLGKRLCANLGIEETTADGAAAQGNGACADMARRILEACDCEVPGAIKPHELEQHVRGDLPAVSAYDKVDDFAARDREHQLRGAAARAEIRAEDAGGFVGLIDDDEARAIARASVTKQRVAAEMAQFAESSPELFGVGAQYCIDDGLRAKRASFLREVEAELKAEGLLNKVGEDWTGLTPEAAVAQIESIVLGGVEVEIDGEDERRRKRMPERLQNRIDRDTRKVPAYWENRKRATKAAA